MQPKLLRSSAQLSGLEFGHHRAVQPSVLHESRVPILEQLDVQHGVVHLKGAEERVGVLL